MKAKQRAFQEKNRQHTAGSREADRADIMAKGSFFPGGSLTTEGLTIPDEQLPRGQT